jgi:hypothetical protein
MKQAPGTKQRNEKRINGMATPREAKCEPDRCEKMSLSAGACK